MADDMMKMGAMGERPPMPDMKGANMRREGPLDMLPEKAKENLMMPSDEIGAVLMARLANMSPQELQMLDKAISPDVAKVLIKLLPELKDLIEAVERGGVGDAMPEDQEMMMDKEEDDMPKDMGALGSM